MISPAKAALLAITRADTASDLNKFVFMLLFLPHIMDIIRLDLLDTNNSREWQ